MKFYKLRVDLSPGIGRDTIVDLVDRFSKTYCYVIEDAGGDNPHMHWYIEMSMSSENLRKGLRDLGLKGNKSYSLKDLDERYPIEYLAYMMKSKGFFLIEGDIPESVLDAAREYDRLLKEEMERKKAEKKKKEIVKIMEYIKVQMKGGKIEDLSSWNIMNFVVDYHKENHKVIVDFRIIGITRMIMILCKDGYQKQYVDRLHRKLED